MVTYSFYESDSRIIQYASALSQRGDVVDIIALRRPQGPKFEVINGVNIYRIQQRKVNERGPTTYLYRVLKFLFLATLVLTAKHLKHRYSLVHVHSVPDFLVVAALPVRMLGARVILDIHDILPEFYASKFGIKPDSWLFHLLLSVEKLSVKLANHVIIANHIWYDRLVQRSTRPEKCSVICNYPDPEVFHSCRQHRNNGKFVLMYPGTLNWHQGVDVAIRAFAKVKDELPNAEFRIYGEGPMKPSLQELVTELGLDGRVTIHDYLPLNEIAAEMAKADLAIVPKRASSQFGNEAASSKIGEFMAAGVPVIVSRTKIDSLYYDESKVKFFESENESDLANCIVMLQHNPQLRSRLVENANAHIRKPTGMRRRESTSP